MLIRLCIFVCLFFLPSALKAEELLGNQVNSKPLTFQNVQFGQPPTSDMVCIKGSCPPVQPTSINSYKKSIFSTYKKTKDITFYNSVEISTPKYDFFEGRFVRVGFTLECQQTIAEMCIESVFNALDKEYGLTLIDKVSLELPPEKIFSSKVFTTKAGEIVEFHWYKPSEKWEKPFVKIYDKDLMDRLRIATNPSYIPVKLNH